MKNNILTQVCLRCHLDDSGDNYESLAITRGYNDCEWSFFLLSELLEVSSPFKCVDEISDYLNDIYVQVEEVSFKEFITSVDKTSEKLNRWDYIDK